MQIKKKISVFANRYGEYPEAEKHIQDYYNNYHFSVKKARQLFSIERFKRDFEAVWTRNLDANQLKRDEEFMSTSLV